MADGQVSTHGPVTHFVRVPLTISKHHEEISLNVTKLQHQPIILGIDWLEKHNPSINWKKRLISFQDEFCNKNCNEQPPVQYSSQSPDLTYLLSCLVSEDYEPTFEDYSVLSMPLSEINTTAPDVSLSSVQSEDLPDPLSFLPEIYSDFAPLFKERPVGTLPPHRDCDHAIPIEPGSKVPFGPLYTLSQAELKALREYLDDNLAKGFIRKSESPAGAPVLFTAKKDGKSLRLCVDYRALNKITVKNRCPLPLISETLDRLSSARIFTKLDLKGAYNLIRIAKGDEWKTAFRTRYGHFEYNVMPFGLTNAPATFQAFLNDVLRECLDEFVVIYLDDILIYSSDEESHILHVRKVLELLMAADLQVNPEKCEFHKRKVEFLGYVISPEGISMDPKKVEVILAWPSPKSVRDIQVFLGFANFYRRFVEFFSQVVSAITRLLKKDVPFVWDNEAQEAFDNLKKLFSSDPILRHFDPEKPCFLEPDASKNALGMVCSQPDANGVLRPLGYYSRSLSGPEKNYHVHDTELLAAIEGLEHFRHYFAYSPFPATILTDHKNLEYFSEKRSLSDRQVRYAERLSKFNVRVVYRPGILNGAADALSRMHPPEGGEDRVHNAILPRPETTLVPVVSAAPIAAEDVEMEPVDNEIVPGPAPGDITERIIEAYQHDELFQEIIDEVQQHPDANEEWSLDNGLWFYNGKIAVPHDEDIQRDILSQCHDGPNAGHFGMHKTYELVSRTYYWPAMRMFIKRFVSTCDVCQRNKKPRHKPYGLYVPVPAPEAPWSSISVDFITQLPPSQGFNAIFVAVDRLTKMAHFVPTTGTVDADALATLFLNHIVSAHGLPDEILTDRGTVFTAEYTRHFLSALHIQQNTTTAYHQQANGQAERTNSTLEQYLRCFLNYQQDDWADLLPMAQFCYNNTIHSSINMTPFFACLGYHPRFSVNVPRVAVNNPRAEHRLQGLQELQEDLKFHIEYANEAHERSYNNRTREQPTLNVNDKVWLLRTNIQTKRPSAKLDNVRLGPFKIVEVIGSRSFRLELPRELSRLHPVFHVSLLEPYLENDIAGRVAPPPQPIEVDGEMEYEVEVILDSRRRYRRLEYLVKWLGYNEQTWQPARDVQHCQDLVQDFHARYPEKPGPADGALGARA